MRRSDLIRELAEAHPNLSPADAERVVRLFFETLIDRLADGGRVELRGFGAFSTRGRKGRIGRNPKSGEAVEVEPKRTVFFRPGRLLRDRLKPMVELEPAADPE